MDELDTYRKLFERAGMFDGMESDECAAMALDFFDLCLPLRLVGKVNEVCRDSERCYVLGEYDTAAGIRTIVREFDPEMLENAGYRNQFMVAVLRTIDVDRRYVQEGMATAALPQAFTVS